MNRLKTSRQPNGSRKVGRLINEWLSARDGLDDNGNDCPPDLDLADRLEFDLHTLLMAKRPGVVFNFAGLACWVDARTPAGRVEARQMVTL
jgi:hypothetical protein